MPDAKALVKQAVQAYKANQKDAAKELLLKAVDMDEHNEQAWMWMSAVVDSLEERQICLENVLSINPHNERAKQGLAVISQKLGKSASSPPAEENPLAGTGFDANPFSSSSSVDWNSGGGAAYGSGKEVELPNEQQMDDWVNGMGLGSSNTSQAPSAPSHSDPFGGAADPWSSGGSGASSAPATGGADPFGGTDPWSGGDSGASSAPATGGADPFGGTDPWSGGDSEASSAPATGGADPFGGADPWGGGGSTASSDPFGSASAGADPWGGGSTAFDSPAPDPTPSPASSPPPAESASPFGSTEVDWGTPSDESPASSGSSSGFLDADIDFGTENLDAPTTLGATARDQATDYFDPVNYPPDFDFEKVTFGGGGLDDFDFDDPEFGGSPFATASSGVSEYFEYIPDEFKTAQGSQVGLLVSVVVLLLLNIAGIVGIVLA